MAAQIGVGILAPTHRALVRLERPAIIGPARTRLMQMQWSPPVSPSGAIADVYSPQHLPTLGGMLHRIAIAKSDQKVEKSALHLDEDLGSGGVREGRQLVLSRLARSCRDWHQLLEVYALFDTLIADTDGVYDPARC